VWLDRATLMPAGSILDLIHFGLSLTKERRASFGCVGECNNSRLVCVVRSLWIFMDFY
jgi:hypothetical protein